MQVPDEEKRRTILKTARDLFTRKPYHVVRLDDVAAAAKVGKGTLYVYFKSKDHLYVELVEEAFDLLLEELETLIDDHSRPAWAVLEEVVLHICRWTAKHPTIFDIIRSGVHPAGADRLRHRRREMGRLIERLIIRGVEAGEFHDPHPEVTANFIPSMARSNVVHGRGNMKPDALARHMLDVLGRGIRGNG